MHYHRGLQEITMHTPAPPAWNKIPLLDRLHCLSNGLCTRWIYQYISICLGHWYSIANHNIISAYLWFLRYDQFHITTSINLTVIITRGWLRLAYTYSTIFRWSILARVWILAHDGFTVLSLYIYVKQAIVNKGREINLNGGKYYVHIFKWCYYNYMCLYK